MGIYQFLSQLNLRKEFLRYGVVTFFAIIFGTIYALLRINGINHWLIFLSLLCSALLTGHYFQNLVQKLSNYRMVRNEGISFNQINTNPYLLYGTAVIGSMTIVIESTSQQTDIQSLRQSLTGSDTEFVFVNNGTYAAAKN